MHLSDAALVRTTFADEQPVGVTMRRSFVLMAVVAFIVCGVTAFYTRHAEHGRTSEELSAWSIGSRPLPEVVSPGGSHLNLAAKSRSASLSSSIESPASVFGRVTVSIPDSNERLRTESPLERTG